ncbi:MAG: carbamoyl phosphate synthase small subunit [Clostridia bacterium]|nr:carbamoyl phosphate synthase small subunit [Clostridia bacterium]
MISIKKAYIVLQNGDIFEGKSFGKEGCATGELVFTTGMGGYIGTLTDPCYYGQIVIQTFPLIGNHGIIRSDFESDGSYVNGYVVREWCEHPSNFRCEGDLDSFLKEKGIVGIYGVDTRQLTTVIRENGVMNAKIVPELTDGVLEGLADYRIINAVKSVSSMQKSVTKPEGEAKYRVTLIDYGSKYNMDTKLAERGCEVTCVPYNTAAEEILAGDPDGIMLSNGPGDPLENTECIEQIKKLVGKKPIFGICLGHQLLALANGAERIKLKYGHRGANQPVKDLVLGKTYITSQNHGYAIDADSIKKTDGKLRYVNANDNSCEGIDYPDLNAFSVQFNPEAPGPVDTEFVFDRFIELMGGND